MKFESSPHAADDVRPRRNLIATLLQPKVGIPILIVVVLVSAPFVYRQSRVADIPDSGPPFDLEKWGTVAIADEDNAIGDYRIAGKLARDLSGTDQAAYDAVLEKGWSEATESLALWLDSNRAALRQLKAAASRPHLVVYQPKSVEIDVMLPEVQMLRNLARASEMEAARLESEGKLDEAWATHLAVFRMSRHSGQHGCLIERLVGISIHAIAVGGIERWSRHPDLTADQLSAALADVREADRMTAPLSRTVMTEYFFLINTTSRADMLELISGSSTTSGSTADATMLRAAMFLKNEPLLGRLILQQAFANTLEHIDKPLPDRPAPQPSGVLSMLFQDPPGGPTDPKRMPAENLAKVAGRSILVKQLMPAFHQSWIAFDRERAKQAALVTALALQIHRRKFGEFPKDLKALVDAKILDAIPIDPSSPAGEPVRYRLDADSFVVWGLGENRRDDGGDVKQNPGHGQPPDVGLVVPLRAE